MGRSAGIRPHRSSNDGKRSKGKQLDRQAKSLTQRLVSNIWACHDLTQFLGGLVSEMGVD